jgi:predicted ATPase/DNA-binding SARP family transcriptional activator
VLFKVLGPLEVRTRDSEIQLRRGRPRSLLHLLLINRRVVLTIDVVADRLWMREEPVDGPNAVHQLISYTRRSLGPEGREVLQTTATGYRLDISDQQVDVWQFEQLVQSAISTAAAPDAARAARGLSDAEAAVRLWRGEPFAESAAYEWTSGDRARLHDAYLQAQESRLEAMLVLGRHREVVLEAQSLAAAYPLREKFHVQLALALYRAGRQSEALEAHRAVRALLATELGLDPGPELRDLERAILSQDPTLDWVEPHGQAQLSPPPPPPVASAAEPEAPHHGAEVPTPYAVTEPPLSMLGREHDLAVARSQLRAGVPYTVTGAAGVGKTRFAWALAGRLAREDHAPVWFVDLSDIQHDDHVAGAAADRIGLTGHHPQDPTERIVAAFSSRSGALFLDGAEHLVGGVSRLVERLVRSATETTVVVTSRRPLGISVERVHQLAPLPLPLPGADGQALRDNVAVRLFCERAQLVKADFELDETAAADVAAIVAVLDGLPMAIEMAAAHSDVSTIRTIRKRLETHVDSLVALRPTVPARLRSLTATIDSSAVLLNDAERRFLSTVSVFPGSFELSAAAAVADTPEEEAFALLASLVRQSLVTVVGDGRYRLLSPVRAYAAARAAESSELAAVRTRHVDWVAELAWASWEAGQGAQDRRQLGELRALLPDARVALEWALETDYMWGAARIGVALSWMWTLHGLAEEGFASLSAVKALSDRTPELEPEHTLARAALLRSLGLLANPMGKLRLAGEVCSEAAELALALDDTDGAAAALLTLGVSQWALGELAEAADSLDHAATLMEARPESWHFVAAKVLRARTSLDAGEADAEARIEDAVETAQVANESHMLGLALACQARQLFSVRSYEGATLVAGEALRVWRLIRYTEGEMMALNILSRASTELGDLTRAQETAREALTIARDTRHRGATCESVESLALAAAAGGRREQALLLLSATGRERTRLEAPVPAGDRAHLEAVLDSLKTAVGDAVRLVEARAKVSRFQDLVDDLLQAPSCGTDPAVTA